MRDTARSAVILAFRWLVSLLRRDGIEGEAMLAGMEAIKKGRPEKMSHGATFNLSDLGLARDTSSRWQSIASIPEAVFEKFVRETLDAGRELTKAASRAGLAR